MPPTPEKNVKKPREVHDLDSVFWWLQKATDHAKALDCPGWETCVVENSFAFSMGASSQYSATFTAAQPAALALKAPSKLDEFKASSGNPMAEYVREKNGELTSS